MDDIRLHFKIQLNNLLSKYVIDADETFEQFVTRHQKMIKAEVLQHSSYVVEIVSSLWSSQVVQRKDQIAAALEALRVPRLNDLSFLDLEDEGDQFDEPQTGGGSLRGFTVSARRVSRLRDLWDVDLESEMNVTEEPCKKNPFEGLRVDRLRELWLADDD
jgi:hypothetical protein